MFSKISAEKNGESFYSNYFLKKSPLYTLDTVLKTLPDLANNYIKNVGSKESSRELHVTF